MASASPPTPSATDMEEGQGENNEDGTKCIQVFRSDGKHIDQIKHLKNVLRLCSQEGAWEEYIYMENGQLVLQYENEGVVRRLLSRHDQLKTMDFTVKSFSPKLLQHARPDENSIQLIGLNASMSDKDIFKVLRKWTKSRKPKIIRADANTAGAIVTFPRKLKDFFTIKKEVEGKVRCIVSKVFVRDLIFVRSFDQKIDRDDLDLYFGRPAVGGGDIRHIYVDVEQKLAVIHFEDPAVVDTVLNHGEHILKGQTLEIIPYEHFFMKEPPRDSSGKDVELPTQQYDEEMGRHSDSPQTDSSDDEQQTKGTAPGEKLLEKHIRKLQRENEDWQKKYMEKEMQLDSFQKLTTEQEAEILQLKSKLKGSETQRYEDDFFHSKGEQKEAKEEDVEKLQDQYHVDSTDAIRNKNVGLQEKLNECLSLIKAKDSELTEMRKHHDQCSIDRTNFTTRINELESNEKQMKVLNEHLSQENCKLKTEKVSLETKMMAMKEKVNELGASCTDNDAETQNPNAAGICLVDEQHLRGPICQEVKDKMINRDDISEMTVISGNTIGSTSTAKYTDKVVVVKTYNSPSSAFHCFERMYSLPEEYCVTAHGIVHESQGVYRLVMEFMDTSLQQMLQTNFTRLTWTDKVEISLRVCRCVDLLHGDNIPAVLGKIGSHKFVVGPNMTIKMYDLEFANKPDLARQYLHQENIMYMPPEHMNSSTEIYTLETERYGLGLLLIEIATGKPISGVDPLSVDSLMKEYPDIYRNVVNRLTVLDPSSRMTVKESIEQLERLLMDLRAKDGESSRI